jgi:hypothetical protein
MKIRRDLPVINLTPCAFDDLPDWLRNGQQMRLGVKPDTDLTLAMVAMIAAGLVDLFVFKDNDGCPLDTPEVVGVFAHEDDTYMLVNWRTSYAKFGRLETWIDAFGFFVLSGQDKTRIIEYITAAAEHCRWESRKTRALAAAAPHDPSNPNGINAIYRESGLDDETIDHKRDEAAAAVNARLDAALAVFLADNPEPPRP